MSYTITTDVFCDGYEDNSKCFTWNDHGGATHGSKIKKKEAWERAVAHGWKRINGQMLCPSCVEKIKNEK